MDSSRILKALNKTFYLFRVLGFDIRVHWTLIAFALYLVVVYSKYYGAPNGLVLGPTFLILLYGIVLIHELGHSLAARRLRIAENHILLSPLGGLAGIGGNPRSPREELIVTFWGPVVHPFMLLVAVPLYYWLGPATSPVIADGFHIGQYGLHVLQQFYWINLGMLLFNLIPAFPMDGGRFLRAFLAYRMYASKATVIAAYIGQAISIAFIILAVLYGGDFKIILAAIGIMNIIVCEQAKNMAPHVDPYGGVAEDPYGLNLYQPDADYYQAPSQPGFFQRLKDERAQRRAEEERRQHDEIKGRVDSILQKVSEGGMDSLTREERHYLNKASKKFRR